MAFLAGMIVLAADAAATSSAPPPHVYLHPPAERCADRGSSDEVVVCGRKDADGHFRLHADGDADARFAQQSVRAQMKLGNGQLSVHDEDSNVGGFASKRAMVTFKLPF